MRHYPLNSPEAMAHILAMFLVSDGEMDENELASLERLNCYEILGITRRRFIDVLHQYCQDLSDEAEHDGAIHLIDKERIQGMLDDVTDEPKRLVLCALALDLAKADHEMSEVEMAIVVHMLEYWHLSLKDIEAAFAA